MLKGSDMVNNFPYFSYYFIDWNLVSRYSGVNFSVSIFSFRFSSKRHDPKGLIDALSGRELAQ